MFLVSVVFVMFIAGQLHGNVLATGDNGIEVDFNNLVRMSENWLLAVDGNEPNDPNESNEPFISDVNITSAGGLFELLGGLIIDIPAGAVSEETSFQIRLLDTEEVEPYLSIGQTEKGFLGGLEIVSDGIVFNEPISITFPVEPLEDPNSLAYLFHLNKDNGTLIPDLPEETDEFAPSRLMMPAEASFGGTYMYDGRDYIAELLTQDLPFEQHYLVLTEVFDALGHNDCEKNPCRCLGMIPIEGAVDRESSNGCTNVAISGAVLFPLCAGRPVQSYSFKEQSIQIAYKMIPDRNYILCEGSLIMTVTLFDLDDKPVENQKVNVRSSKPNLLRIISSEEAGNTFLLERVGQDRGIANVVIDAGCGITRNVPIRLGCKVPKLTGRWSITGSETWWGCQEFGDNGTYPFSGILEIESQVGTTFAGSISYERHHYGPDYHVLETYDESYIGEIEVIEQDCDDPDQCEYKISGSTDYTETFLYLGDPDNEPYEIKGVTTFSGNYNNGVMTLTSLGFDTKGDTCQTSGSVTLRR